MKPQALAVLIVIIILFQLGHVFAQEAPHKIDENIPCAGCHTGDKSLDGNPADAGITRPTITSATATSVTVSGVVSGEIVDVYLSDYDGSGLKIGDGKTPIGSATASGTSVDVSVSGVSAGQWVTATRTSFSGTAGNTSAFSSNVQVQ